MTIQQILESLRPYAGDPPVGGPPEVLPRDPGDAWGLNGAARGPASSPRSAARGPGYSG